MTKVEVDWDRYAEQYDRITISGSNPAYLELVDKVTMFFKELGLKKGSLVVDLGGGTGNFTLPIAEMHPESHFIIVDLSEIMLQKAKQKAEMKNLRNVDVIQGDIENIEYLVDTYSRPFTHAMMIHCLYVTGSLERPEKPQRILKNIHGGLENSDSRFFIVDINRPWKAGGWIPYCLWHAYKTFGSIKETIKFFIENDQAKIASRYTDIKQKEGSYLMCSLDEFVEMIKDAGFKRIYEKSDQYYRKRDNLVIAGK
ncbi:MAG: methyltransferase domain-containing protein [Deltaproteobacteria bacterium]|nr:methyltransferase domain-containing protein [Deltaproteobacteria bacterium]